MNYHRVLLVQQRKLVFGNRLLIYIMDSYVSAKLYNKHMKTDVIIFYCLKTTLFLWIILMESYMLLIIGFKKTIGMLFISEILLIVLKIILKFTIIYIV